MSLLYRKFKFEIEYCSGKLELFECSAPTWKLAWGLLGDHIRLEVDGLEVDGLDSIVNVGLC